MSIKINHRRFTHASKEIYERLLEWASYFKTGCCGEKYFFESIQHFNFVSLLTLFRMGIFGAAHRSGGVGWGGGGLFAQNLSHISYNDETWHSYTLAKEDPKNIWITWHTPWVLLTSAYFTVNQQILLYQEIHI